jgi:hypothetical protein
MPTKFPKAYEVKGYKEAIDAATALSKLKWPNTESILTNFLAEEDVVWVRDKARVKRQEYITDKKTFSELKTEKTNGEISESQLQILAELKSKLEVWYDFTIYRWEDVEDLDHGGTMDQWVVYFTEKQQADHKKKNGYDMPYSSTLVRNETWIKKSFENVEIKNCNNKQEATSYLKKAFADYAHYSPDIFKDDCENWFDGNIDYNKLFLMVHQRAKDKWIPYAGWKISGRDHNWVGSRLHAWLPVCIRGKFACLWSDSDNKTARFYCDRVDGACLSVLIRN